MGARQIMSRHTARLSPKCRGRLCFLLKLELQFGTKEAMHYGLKSWHKLLWVAKYKVP